MAAVARSRGAALALARRASSSSAPAAALAPSASPIGIVMMNMGGPSSLTGAADGVSAFLKRLFSDSEIIQLGGGRFQDALGTFVSSRRSPRIQKQYAAIGGKSPIGDWTALQGAALLAKLSALHPAQAAAGGFRVYTAFRYAPPLTAAALRAMEADGVTRAVAFSQYPQFSCTTTGSSLNHLWRESLRLGLQDAFTWSIIDRWHSHPAFLAAVARCVAAGLARFPAAERASVPIVFSAHSVPMMVVNRGDQYVGEVAATVAGVMALVRGGGEGGGAPRNPHVLAWQSKVGFLPWMGPPTGEVLKGLARQGHKRVLVVPVAFTSDHVETLYEIDVEYAEEARALGMLQFERAPSLNGEELFSDALADIAAAHLGSGAAVDSPQYAINCPGCVNPACRSMLRAAAPYEKLRDAAGGSAVPRWPTEADAAACRALGDTPNK